jgi:hypothetical protein
MSSSTHKCTHTIGNPKPCHGQHPGAANSLKASRGPGLPPAVAGVRPQHAPASRSSGGGRHSSRRALCLLHSRCRGARRTAAAGPGQLLDSPLRPSQARASTRLAAEASWAGGGGSTTLRLPPPPYTPQAPSIPDAASSSGPLTGGKPTHHHPAAPPQRRTPHRAPAPPPPAKRQLSAPAPAAWPSAAQSWATGPCWAAAGR